MLSSSTARFCCCGGSSGGGCHSGRCHSGGGGSQIRGGLIGCSCHINSGCDVRGRNLQIYNSRTLYNTCNI